MSQPPGPYDAYDDSRGAPRPYGPVIPYGQASAPPPWPPHRPKRNLLPWLIVGGAVLLSGIGLLLVVLFTGDAPATAERVATTAPEESAASSVPSSPSRETPLGELPGGAQVAEPTASAAGAFEGSEGVALGWVEAMAQGDWTTAYDLSCAEVQEAAATASAGGDPAFELGRFFYEQTLGGVGFTHGRFDSLEHDPVTGTDVGVFSLDLEDGGTFTLLVYVRSDLTVCDFR